MQIGQMFRLRRVSFLNNIQSAQNEWIFHDLAMFRYKHLTEISRSLRSQTHTQSCILLEADGSRNARYVYKSCSLPVIIASGPECSRTIPKLVKQTHNFPKECMFYEQWDGRSEKTVDCQVEAKLPSGLWSALHAYADWVAGVSS
jgi:hypothetical protein